jgi:rSAM/selenodomain-associated transferase 2
MRSSRLFSIIIPVLNEGATIAAALEALAPYRARGVELIVVDGGSRDGTVTRARPLADVVLAAQRGRGTQMNAGAAVARGDVLLFLHADTRLPAEAERIVLSALAASGRVWGRFDVAISGQSALLKVIATLINVRSRLSGIATGDQSMFMTRSAFAAAGRFPDIPLMEDLELSKRLKRLSRPICLRHIAITSGRRWQRHGLASTIVTMWSLRLAYFFGADPVKLARYYGYAQRQD